MAKPPVPDYRKQIEADALDYARRWCKAQAEGDFLPRLPYPAHHPQAGHGLFRLGLKDSALLDPLFLTDLATLARAGLEDARLVLQELIARYHNEPLPPVLYSYNLEVHRGLGPKLRGRQPAGHFLQDLSGALLVILLEEQFGLRRTRRSLRHESAYSIAAQAMREAGLRRGGEDAVRKMYVRWAPFILRGWHPQPPRNFVANVGN